MSNSRVRIIVTPSVNRSADEAADDMADDLTNYLDALRLASCLPESVGNAVVDRPPVRPQEELDAEQRVLDFAHSHNTGDDIAFLSVGDLENITSPVSLPESEDADGAFVLAWVYVPFPDGDRHGS